MVLFIILGMVVLLAAIVLGVLFFMLAKEEQEKLAFESKASFPPHAVQAPVEDELRAVIQKADGRLNEAKQRIETLTKENESFKDQQAKLEQDQQKLVVGLQAQLELTNEKGRLLEEEISRANAKVHLLEEEISRANATVSELNREKEELLSAPKPELPKSEPPKPEPDEALRHELESLKYELIKAKAQTSGLERVSFNYKNQLEDFFKKVNAAQASNEQLSQGKNRLEEMVQEIKLQNEELVKKDQLAQFELEKNRSRLASLEREYEDFKARTQNNPK
jgi:chromosome segregation ATPase